MLRTMLIRMLFIFRRRELSGTESKSDENSSNQTLETPVGIVSAAECDRTIPEGRTRRYHDFYVDCDVDDMLILAKKALGALSNVSLSEN